MSRLLLPPMGQGLSNVEWTEVHSVVIIGANGSGKSRVGAWIEEKISFSPVHRVAAQRALIVPDLVNPMPYERATSMLYYGSYEADWGEDQHRRARRVRRWNNDPIGHPLSDFEFVLSSLFANQAKRDRQYATAAQVAIPADHPPLCSLDVLRRVWAAVFPHRDLKIGQDRISASVPHSQIEYAGKQMSDGERVAFYLIGQVLCAPKGAILVIDEPEIHLHRAVQATLWDEIEKVRPDCVFVYITHDLDFAASRSLARKIWMKSFDGTHWEWEEIEPVSDLPGQLLFQVLGSRRPVAFVEGDEQSDDASLYRALYADQTILPLADCKKVIEAVKSMTRLQALHHLGISGIVDRDHRSEAEIAALQKAGIRVADVAEVENLFCITPALEAAATQLKLADVKFAAEAAKNEILQALQAGINQQIASRAIAEIQFQLGGFGPKNRNADAKTTQAEVDHFVKTINVAASFQKSRELFENVLSTGNYDAALRYFNCKGTPALVARSLGISAQTYRNLVTRLVQDDPQGPVADEMRKRVS